MNGHLEEMLAVASAAARAASELLAHARPSDVRGKSNPRDLVTEWDLRSEELIRTVLEERAPGIPVLGEEAGQPSAADRVSVPRAACPETSLERGNPLAGQPSAAETSQARGNPFGRQGVGGSSGLRWLVDPIDGTVNFAHGLPIWAVSIALEDAGRLLAGVVTAPALGWWFEATAGGGAYDGDGEPLRVSSLARLDHALLVTGFPYDRATSPQNNFAEWEHFQRTAGACRRLGAASLDLCLVARGWMDGYWERKLKPWDVGAGALIVLEAGGTVTNTRGGPFDPHGGEVVASNGAIHQELVAELGRVHTSASDSAS